MKKYAFLLACLAWTFASDVSGQTAGGGAAAGGAAGSTGATGGAPAAGTAVGVNRAPIAPGNLRRIPPGLQTPTTPPPTTGVPGVGNPGGPATGTGAGAGVGAGTGAIGGVGPGVGGTGGNAPLTGINPLDQGVSATTGVQPGAGSAGLQTGVTTQPGVGIGETGAGTISLAPGTPADLTLAQRVRAELLNPGMAVGGANQSPAIARAQGQGMISSQSLANVQITANGGAVILRGSVPTPVERSLIENRIRRLGGVRTVVNNLTVGTAAGGNVIVPGTSRAVGTPGTGVTGTGGVDQNGNPVTPPGATAPR